MKDIIIATLISLAISAVLHGINHFSARRAERLRQQNKPIGPAPPAGSRNILCHVCAKSVSSKDYEMPCGHRCHRACFQLLQRNSKSGNIACGYCENNSEDAYAVGGSSSGPSSNKCSFCCGPMIREQPFVTLPCQHFAHFDCYDSKERLQCQMCSSFSGSLPSSSSEIGQSKEESKSNKTKSDECNRCGIPIGYKEKRAQLPCGHSVHQECEKLNMIRCNGCHLQFSSEA